MPRRPLIRLLAAAISGGAVALGLLGVLLVINDETGFTRTTAMTHFGWLVPVFAGVTVAGVAWALLASHQDPDAVPDLGVRCECESCGGTVLGDWRLCPHCGYRFPERP